MLSIHFNRVRKYLPILFSVVQTKEILNCADVLLNP